MYKCNLIVMITLGPKDTLCLSKPTQKLIVYKLNDKNESTLQKFWAFCLRVHLTIFMYFIRTESLKSEKY